MKRHYYPTHELKAIKQLLISHMVKGKFGQLPIKGARGKRASDGGIYKRTNSWVTKSFGYPIGHGTINKCKDAAVEILAKQKTPTSIVRPANVDISPRLMLRRMTGKGTIRQQAFVESIKASYTVKINGGYPASKALTPKELTATQSMYKKLVGK